MRKMQEIATPLSRLAMTSKWDSNGFYPLKLGSATLLFPCLNFIPDSSARRRESSSIFEAY
jgi:hypothetical protein